MTTTINASTSSGLVVTPDNSGTIQLQSNGTTKATVSSAGFASPGCIIQVVQASISTTVSTSGTTYVTSGLTATITPKFATSKILVNVSGGAAYANSNGCYGENVLYRNSSQISSNSVDWGWYSSTAGGTNHSYMYLDSPATTSATSYTPYFRISPSGNAGTYYFNLIQTTGPTVIVTLMEVAQ